MERASLRPVPSRPKGTVAPADALGYVTRELPGIDPPAAAAFALVALVGRPRAQLAASPDAGAASDLSDVALADALARARKALRRKLHPLPGSGWCERAERLISDRLDDALEDPGPARLEVHLANCDRCLEHERRLSQAQAALVVGFEKAQSTGHPESEGHPPRAEREESPVQPALRVVDTPILPPTASPPEALPTPTAEPVQPPDSGSEQDALTAPRTAAVAPSSGGEPQPPAPAPAAGPPPPSAAAASRPVRSAYWAGPAASAPVRPAHWVAPGPASPPPAPWAPSPTQHRPGAWEAAASRPVPAARAALQQDTWTSIGPLVVVLLTAVVIFVIAGLLAVG